MTTDKQSNLVQTETDEIVLDAVQKGFTRVCELTSYCGPELINVNMKDTQRELDVPQVMRAIQRMIQIGYLERVGQHGISQLDVRITDEGRKAAPPMSDRDEELVSKYNISSEALEVLVDAVEYEETHGSLPSMSQLKSETETSLVTYQIQPLFKKLIDVDLAEARGLFRFKIDPTDKGRTVVKEFADLLEDR